jgi:hypothetical protein
MPGELTRDVEHAVRTSASEVVTAAPNSVEQRSERERDRVGAELDDMHSRSVAREFVDERNGEDIEWSRRRRGARFRTIPTQRGNLAAATAHFAGDIA